MSTSIYLSNWIAYADLVRFLFWKITNYFICWMIDFIFVLFYMLFMIDCTWLYSEM